MYFSYVEFPLTVNPNTFKAYFTPQRCKLPDTHGEQSHKPGDSEINTQRVKSLRHFVLDAVLENWNENPFFQEIERQEDRNYILSNLNVNLPLRILSSHIQDDFFWRKSFQQRWKTLYYMLYTYQTQPPSTALSTKTPLLHSTKMTIATATTTTTTTSLQQKAKPWINIYMERHLQEFIENVTTTDYDQESVQEMLDVCATYINQLEINFLQPSLAGQNHHIPLDFILRNLPELHTLRLTYCTKTIGMQFYLGCNVLSRRDASLLSQGLQQCHELVHFCLHNTKLEPYQLGLFAHSLDKGCHYLSTLSLEHCSLGDEGIRQFLASCNKESFGTLKYLDLTNNKITCEGAYMLSKVLQSLALEKLVLRLNPIGSDGAAPVLSTLEFLPITYLDIAACSLDDSITKLFMQLIVQNKTLRAVDISNNNLGQSFGKHLLKVIGFNKILKSLDLRNTGVPLDSCKIFHSILKENHSKEHDFE